MRSNVPLFFKTIEFVLLNNRCLSLTNSFFNAFCLLQGQGEKLSYKGNSTATTPSSDRKRSLGSSPEPHTDEVSVSFFSFNLICPHQNLYYPNYFNQNKI